MSDTARSPSAEDFIAIVDALYRFGAGQDLRDRALSESAFSSDAVLDFTQPARGLGAKIAPFEGRQAIADTVFATIGDLDTTHTVTNPRVTTFDGGRAETFALVEAQHLPRGDHSRHLLLKHVYTLRLTREGAQWTIDHMRIDMVWFTGDRTVLFPAAG
ncbi:MAG TPA: nuclear transport factor 2 family protein [Rhodanobacteraceae bacterium]|nr:nuclear transport factor 2 family protein [Rhodanobacteraceae bacterium]